MTSHRTTSVVDRDELARRLRPRDDLVVREVADTPPADATTAGPDAAPGPTGAREFTSVDGPFRSYRRRVEWAPAADDDPAATELTESFEYRLAIPYWSALYRPLARRALRDGVAPGRRPWWSTPDRLGPQQSTVVATMALHNVVGGALFAVLTQVLTYASADLGTGSSSEQATVFAVVRLGVLVTIAATALADRAGRRRIAVWSFAAAAVLTVLTAAAPSLAVLTALQLVARNLVVAGLLCVDTITIEELPAGSRAMASGLGAMAYGLGAGLVIVCLPLAGLTSWSWRLVFLLAGLTVPLLAHARRHLPESRRFERLDAARRRGEADESARGGRTRLGRFVLLAVMFFLVNAFVAPTSQLQNDYMRTERGMSATMIAVLLIVTSTPGAIGIVVGGRWADTRGRRAAIVPGLLAVGVFNAMFFSFAGPPMWVASLCGSMFGALCVPALAVLSSELFPTARRGGVRGMLSAVGVGGSVAGLLLAGHLVDARGYGPTFTLLAAAPVVAGLLAFAVPETRGRELEDLNR